MNHLWHWKSVGKETIVKDTFHDVVSDDKFEGSSYLILGPTVFINPA